VFPRIWIYRDNLERAESTVLRKKLKQGRQPVKDLLLTMYVSPQLELTPEERLAVRHSSVGFCSRGRNSWSI
jgi:hypothetical protein